MKRFRYLTYSLALCTIVSMCLINSCSDENTVIPDENLRSSTDTKSGTLQDSEVTIEEDVDCNFITISSIELTDIEKEMLLFVREEEKMAHDVYLFYSEIFKKPVFTNIMKSEKVHMDRVLCLLIHFNIDDPASDEPGKFTNPDLQEMYNNLISLGSGTIIDALTAGATIEDFDIKDINGWIALTDNEAIIKVFTCLACASGNHLIAFTTLLDGYDVQYSPQYISSSEYLAIINDGHQFCGF